MSKKKKKSSLCNIISKLVREPASVTIYGVPGGGSMSCLCDKGEPWGFDPILQIRKLEFREMKYSPNSHPAGKRQSLTFHYSFVTMVLSQGDFVPRGMFEDVWRHFSLSQLGVGMLLVSCE